MKVLGIITARGGSKGVPRKNIAPVAGRPLLSWTADAALRANRLSRVILSTDDEEIAAVGRSCGLEVPFMRPAELAGDATPTLPVLQHAVRFVGDQYDAVCLLQPTNPLRNSALIDGCIELFENSHADSVVTVLPVPHEYNPHWVYWRDSAGVLSLVTGESAPVPRRQDLPPAFHREGSVYVTSTSVLMEGNSLYGRRVIGYPLQAADSVNIDSPQDLAFAEEKLARRAAAGHKPC